MYPLLITAIFSLLAASMAPAATSNNPTSRPAHTLTPAFIAPSLIEMDLEKIPSEQDLMAAGQLGGLLVPTEQTPQPVKAAKTPPQHSQHKRSVAATRSLSGGLTPQQSERLAFGRAIQKWNQHHYQQASSDFAQFTQNYPNSPWKSEATLHMGCEARFNGRYQQARRYFEKVIQDNQNKATPGAQKMLAKAQSRLAVLDIMENNPQAAQELFTRLQKNAPDWRLRTYASHWLLRNNAQQKSPQLLNCGTQALAQILRAQGHNQQAKAVLKTQPGPQGFTINNLIKLAKQHHQAAYAVRIDLEKTRHITTPAILHMERSDHKGSGHYWILESLNKNRVVLFDPQMRRRFTQSHEELRQEWQGNAIVFSKNYQTFAQPLSTKEAQSAFGGCCGVQRAEADLGPPADDHPGCSAGHGAPYWTINPVNMNFYAKDIPLWYTPAIGPRVDIALSYNSQSALAQNEPFGNKWMFNYSSYIVTDPAFNLTVFEATGARATVTPRIGQNNGQYPGYPDQYLASYQDTKDYSVTALRADETDKPAVFRTIIGYKLTYKNGSSKTYGVPPGTHALQHFLLATTNKYGQSLTFNYDDQARMTQITDAQGKQTQLTYNRQNLITQVTDPFGRSAKFTYDQNRNLIGLTDMQGYTTKVGYDNDRYITYLEDAKGRTRFHTEPADGDSSIGMNSYPPFDGPMWENYRITVTDPLNNNEEYYYDGYHGTGWYVSKEHYNAKGNKNSLKTRYHFARINNRDSQVDRITDPDGTYIAKTFNGPHHEVTRITNHLGQSEQFSYNPQGSVTQYIDTLERTTHYTYAENGIDLLKMENDTGTTTYQYDKDSQLTQTTDPKGQSTHITYNPYGQVTQITNPLGQKAQYRYNDQQQLSQILQGKHILSQLSYDAIGRISQQTNRYGNTTHYRYNNLNTLINITYPDGTQIQRQYNSCPGLLEAETFSNGRTTTYHYDANKQLTQIIEPNNSTITYQRDKNGDIKALQDQNHYTTRFVRNTTGEVTDKIYPDQSLEHQQLDRGRVQSVTNARGQTTTYTYNAKQQLASIHYSDNTPGVEFHYNLQGQLTQAIDGQGTHSYHYDPQGELTQYDGPYAKDQLSFHYDALDRLQSLRLNEQRYETFQYDDLGHLWHLQTGGNHNAFQWYYSVDNAPNPFTESSYPGHRDEIFQQDNQGRLESIRYRRNQKNILVLNYHYNTAGLISDIQSTRDEPIDTTPPSIRRYNNLNQLVHHSAYPNDFQYDADGNMTQGYLADGALFNAQYNSSNRLTQLQYQRAGKTVTETFAYFYNGLLARHTRSQNGTLQKDTRYLRLGTIVLQEYDANDTITATNYWSLQTQGGIGELIKRTQGPYHTDHYYHYDRNGNVVRISDREGGTMADLSYSAYGKILKGSNYTPYGYASKPLLESGLIDFGYRYYLPHLGIWLTRDPLGLAGGINAYEYAGGNPVMRVDPLGLWVGPMIPPSVVDTAAGFGDALTLGGTNWLRDLNHTNQWVNPCSLYYTAGQYGGYGVGATLGGAGARTAYAAVRASRNAAGVEQNVDKWSREPKSIQDRMTLDAAKRGEGDVIGKDLGDPRFKDMEKWEYREKSKNGRDSVVHYVRDPKTGKRMDFKFKKHSTD